jgi:AraC-like DNA-binding protein
MNLSLRIINNHETWALENFSNMKEITLSWLKKLFRYYRILWVVWIPFMTAFLLFFRFQLLYLSIVLILYFLMLVLTYLTYWIALQGMSHRAFVFVGLDSAPRESKNFGRLTNDEIQGHVIRITNMMTEKKEYLNENLSLRDLASHLDADPNLISFILNNHMSSNFYDFVNRYRIDEVKNKLNDPAFKHLTLLGIALESGFNSKTTFNRIFKQVTGVTPSEFQKNFKNGQ